MSTFHRRTVPSRARRRQALVHQKHRVVAAGEIPAGDLTRIGRLARTPTPCSCRMCGNPRRWAKGKLRLTSSEHGSRALIQQELRDMWEECSRRIPRDVKNL